MTSQLYVPTDGNKEVGKEPLTKTKRNKYKIKFNSINFGSLGQAVRPLPQFLAHLQLILQVKSGAAFIFHFSLHFICILAKQKQNASWA